MVLGELIATGSRSTVHVWGADTVAKVPRSSTPDAWIRYEAGYSTAARLAGAPVPEFLGFESVGARTASVYRHARGPVMWDDLLADPRRAAEHGRRLADLQRTLATLAAPCGVPRQRDRVGSKIRIAAALVDPSLAVALDAIPTGGPALLCHGDLHPSNVILTTDGPMLVDWFDACLGDPVADIARTALLLTAETAALIGLAPLADRARLPLDRIRESYLAATGHGSGGADPRLQRWLAVMAVARIAEGVDSSPLVARWRDWSAVERAG